MASIPPASRVVVGGVDTHKDLHVAAVIDTGSFSTICAGYRAMLRWMRGHGDVRLAGIEGTGSDGAGITRHLIEAGVEVVEVNRPDRVDRRRRGKSDTIDAENSARAALSGQRTHTLKSKAGKVESLRVLRLTRSTAVRSRRVARCNCCATTSSPPPRSCVSGHLVFPTGGQLLGKHLAADGYGRW